MSGSHIVVVLTDTKGDVERHRVCDNKGGGAITRSDRGEPFNTRANVHRRRGPVGPTPNKWEDDTTLTAYLPPSGCRIVQR